jgi:hypothetical protein
MVSAAAMFPVPQEIDLQQIEQKRPETIDCGSMFRVFVLIRRIR